MIHYETRGEIALICMDNPPVNALCLELRQGIVDAHAKAVADPDIRARAAELAAEQPWAIETWDRIAAGITFQGADG